MAYIAYGSVVAIAELIMAALLLGFNGSVFNFASLFVNLFMRDCVNCSCAVACVVSIVVVP